MILIYNFLLLLLLVAALPFIVFRSFFDKRLRYGLRYRFFPQSIEYEDYILIHASSFGEIKSVLPFARELKSNINGDIVYSVFTDTAHKFIKDRDPVLMPVDFYPFYIFLFRKKPKIAIFFETEIWPSYLKFLKRNNVPVVLINARMSYSSFKLYKRFGFFFKNVIGSFDLILAKSKNDAKRFVYFNSKTVVCGNIKRFKEAKNFQNVRKDFKINSNKPILTMASFHREEANFVISVVDELKEDFFVVIAPRHMEDVEIFERMLTSENIRYVKRTDCIESRNVLLLDTLGELEKIYSISEVSIVGGSFHPSLKGHNPIEPLVYKNKVIIGPFIESFEEEVEDLEAKKLICRIREKDGYLVRIKSCLDSFSPNLNAFFHELKYILDCYVINTIKIKKS